MKLFFLLPFLLYPFIDVVAQTDSFDLESVTVTATRIPTQSPTLAISTYKTEPVKLIQQQLSLQEYIQTVPGLFSLNANNYAQDLRISIRGFGARSAFGIRGIKLIVDGIPATTPDGQGQIDNLNLYAINNVEVIRGPAASRYGNASGGVISMTTDSEVKQNELNGGVTFGSYNMQNYQLGVKYKKGYTQFIGQAVHTRIAGYRNNSGMKSTNLNGRLSRELSNGALFTLLLNGTFSPLADDPGGLTLDEVDEDRRMARDRNLQFDTGERVYHGKVGLTYNDQINERLAYDGYFLFSARSFDGKLPFSDGGIVDLRRNYYIHGGSFTFNQIQTNGSNKIMAGYELGKQDDFRDRYFNVDGERARQVLNQGEYFSTVAAYVIDEWTFKQWVVNTGLRFDLNWLRLVNQNNGEEDNKTFPTLNPSIGLGYQLKNGHQGYANFSTSFETPVLSELTAGQLNGQFNENLEAQFAYNYEVGWKGLIGQSMQFDLALFHIDTNNDLVPFESEDQQGITQFKNAGKTRRQGLELALQYHLSPHLQLDGNYTFSQFKYRVFDTEEGSLAGNFLPGIPQHNANFFVRYLNTKGFNAQLHLRHTGDLYTSDDNEVKDQAYTLLNLNIGYTWKRQKYTLIPYFGINNLLNTKYNDNIRINAFGRRYYEPGPEQNFFFGIRFMITGESNQ